VIPPTNRAPGPTIGVSETSRSKGKAGKAGFGVTETDNRSRFETKGKSGKAGTGTRSRAEVRGKGGKSGGSRTSSRQNVAGGKGKGGKSGRSYATTADGRTEDGVAGADVNTDGTGTAGSGGDPNAFLPTDNDLTDADEQSVFRSGPESLVVEPEETNSGVSAAIQQESSARSTSMLVGTAMILSSLVTLGVLLTGAGADLGVASW